MAMIAAEPSFLPWDTSVGNRFAHYSAVDHSATVWIATALTLTYVVGILLIRIFIKWRVFGWDDSLVVISTLFACVQCIAVLNALNGGLGKVTGSVQDLHLIGNLVFVSRALLVVAHHFAKLSVLSLLRRLFVRDHTNTARLCNITIGFTALSGAVSVLVSTVRCPSSKFFVDHCNHQIERWVVVTALDVTTEGLILTLPCYMVWQVQMRLQTKLRVIAAFGFRSGAIALSAAHLNMWTSYSRGRPSPFDIVPTFIMQQALLAASLISATIPNLKAFLESLSASWGEAGFGSAYTTRAVGNGTFEMSNMGLHAPTTSGSRTDHDYPVKGRPSFKTQVTTLRRVTDGRSSLESHESQDRIIRKETAWTVERNFFTMDIAQDADAPKDVRATPGRYNLRKARFTDLSSIARVWHRAFFDDEIIGDIMHPHREQYPEHVYWFHLRGIRERFWDWRHQFMVVVTTNGQNQEVVVGAADWRRLGEKGACRELSRLDPRNVIAPALHAYHNTIEHFFPNRAADASRSSFLDAAVAASEVYWTGERAECWDLHVCGVDPEYQGKGVGRMLAEWGVKEAEKEGSGTCAGVLCGEKNRGFYGKAGFVVQVGGKQGEGGGIALFTK
ncbi:hypothetical protein M011DRAFT_528121 [Sporormia fimetaria CBS 119925]|uniref:N-acetyltransferase domain-containing protein n=1 Tax=Sporormia fimetaria CBS 119925 TaxID=1340428 RepID=A0A6A6V4V8_9PLEO|nr:hypothetical protein M011DRAFT_528121 [Sporormia fimetaria CBS 119925]